MIKINDDWHIDSDGLNFILRKLNPKAKLEKHRWTVVGYYPTINALLSGMVNHRLIGSVHDDLDGMRVEMEHIKHDLRAGKWGTPRDFKKAIAEYGQEQIV